MSKAAETTAREGLGADLLAAPASSTRLAVGVCLVMSLNLVSTWLLNVTAYPGFNDVFPEARDIATTTGGVLCLLFAFLAMRRPRLFAGRHVLVIGMVSGLLGASGMFAASALGSPVLATVTACLRSLSGCANTIFLASALMRLDGRRCFVAVVCAGLLKYLWMGALWFAPTSVRSVAFVAIVTLLPLLLGMLAWPALRGLADAEPADSLSVTNPLSFLPLTNRMFVAILLFQAAMGFAITFGSQNSYPQPTILACAVFVTVAAVCLARRRASLDLLYAVAYGLVLAGLLLAPWMALSWQGAGALAGSLSNALLDAGSGVISMVIWLMVATLGRRNPLGALPMTLMVGAAQSFGTEMGALMGHLQNYLLATANLSAGVLSLTAITLAFALYNFLMARRFSFDATIAEVRPVQAVAEVDERDQRVPAIERACEGLVASRGLTAREAQVLGLLARGRNAAYIQESLTISRNTVKSYVARVYGKLGVHSHQELIDLVESVGEGEDEDGWPGDAGAGEG